MGLPVLVMPEGDTRVTAGGAKPGIGSSADGSPPTVILIRLFVSQAEQL